MLSSISLLLLRSLITLRIVFIRTTPYAAAALLGLCMVTSVCAQSAVPSSPNWTLQSAATNPPQRYGSASAYHAGAQHVVLFGGRTDSSFYGDTWTYDGTTWTQKSPASLPPARTGPAMAYDPVTENVVMFGGLSASGTFLSDTWLWNGTTWTQQFPAASPTARQQSALVYDAAIGGLVLFGGSGVGGTGTSALLGDTWTYNGSTWAKQSSTSSPTARVAANVAYNPANSTVVLFGGQSTTGYANDTWTYNGTNWTQQVPVSSPSRRAFATMAFDPALSSIVLFGGQDINGNTNGDTWTYNGTNWTQQTPATIPLPRFSSTSAYLPSTGAIIMFGGDELNNSFLGPGNDTYAYGTGSTFGPTPVGTSAAQTTLNFTLTTTGTLPALSNANVLTTGISGLDFTLGTGSTCAGVVTAGQTCTVNVAFTPKVSGVRSGAVNLFNSSGTILATAFLSGIGTAPLTVTYPGTQSQVSGVTGSLLFEMTTDAAGNVYVGDYLGNTVKKYSVTGSSATLLATIALGQCAGQVAVDGAGNLFVVNCSSSNIWRVPFNPAISTYGTPVTLFTSSPGTRCYGVAVDTPGNLYLGCGAAILKSTFTGTAYGAPVTLFSGLSYVTAVVLDASGNLYAADNGASATTGKVYKATNTAGTFGALMTIASGYNNPNALALDAAGNVYVSTQTNNGITRLTPSGATYTPSVIGSGVVGINGVAVAPNGNVYLNNGGSALYVVNVADPMTLTFPSTTVGNTSASQTVMPGNIGNLPLNFSVPTTGSNPTVAGPYVLTSSGTCPQISSSGTVQTLASASTCTDVLTFKPTAGGTTIPGTFTFTDNSNNAAGATQTVNLTGSSPAATTTTAFIQGSGGTVAVGGNITLAVQVVVNVTAVTAGTVAFTSAVGGTTYPLGNGIISGATYQLVYNAAYAGANTITATFTPTNSQNYLASSVTAPLTVTKSTPVQYTGTNDQIIQSKAASTLTIILGYPGTVAPTGAIIISINGVSSPPGLGAPTCKAKSLHMNCAYLYTSPLAQGQYPLTYTQAADSNYNASSGTSTLMITAPAAPALRPRPAAGRRIAVVRSF